ncbi:potassium transporter peripheral membrane component [Haladaptatus paucihalophilus DX253]|uniref:Potassium transporter peripheral membrane component n=1 Tax=Haladaptatus paucihalophilus DX253 TaxID=797209 RepID=E7QZS0_HALPU|nr:Trk system potassium transporter TrkA [Haladaptatus paucihalophilus]EFW89814.1 potassium transporter peripheral membrane component [Haladaptatus paucihalophilus DX253]SHK55122.1 trk system potassium uptake protein TrkA [Haladaptatus paucihalophilus DX253]
MRIVIVGAGEVGSSIAASLSDTHEVVVVDRDGERVESLTYSLDVLPIQGDGTSLDTLRDAGIERADMVIASTDDDETNLVVCGTAKTVDDPFTIARVKKVDYLQTWENADPGAFGVDFLVCTNLLTATDIVRVIGLPAARDVDPFAGGKVQMAEFEVRGDSPLAEQTIRQADRFDSLTFAAVIRDRDVDIPRGETVIQADDKVVVIGSPESVQQFAKEVAPDETPSTEKDVVVIGGSEIGFHTARLLENRNLKPRLVEQNSTRARSLAEALPGTVVMASDATDTDFLMREHVDEADVVVAALENDEKNLLVSLLVRQLGAERAIAIVENTEYVSLFETVGIDVVINPREVTAEEITRFTREERAENIALIENDRAEVLEIEIDANSVLVDRPISEGVANLPDGVVIGAITRNGEFIVPRGDTVVKQGDHIVVFAHRNVVSEVSGAL